MVKNTLTIYFCFSLYKNSKKVFLNVLEAFHNCLKHPQNPVTRELMNTDNLFQNQWIRIFAINKVTVFLRQIMKIWWVLPKCIFLPAFPRRLTGWLSKHFVNETSPEIVISILAVDKTTRARNNFSWFVPASKEWIESWFWIHKQAAYHLIVCTSCICIH